MTTESQEPIKIIKLKYPFMWGQDEQVTEIQIIRRPKAKDMKGLKSLKDMDMSDQNLMISRFTNLTPPQLDELDMEDFGELGKVIESFLESSLETGKVI